MVKNQKNINPEEIHELSGKLTQIMNVVQLQNHHLDFIPERDKLPSEDVGFYYAMVYRSLGNVHEVNQDLILDLDNIALRLSEIADELEQ